MRRFVGYASLIAIAALGAAALFHPQPLLCLHYPVWITNDALLAPVRVVAIDGNQLSLADGRVLRVGSKDVRALPSRIRASGYRVDIEEWPNGVTMIYGPVELTRCGTPWTSLINIPIFADPTPRYWRRPIAWQDANSLRDESGSG